MIERLKRAFWWLLVLQVLLGLGANQLNNFSLKTSQYFAQKKFEQSVLEGEKKAISLLDEIAFKSIEENKQQFKQLQEGYNNKALAFYIYENDSLALWDNIEVLPPFYFREFYRPTFISSENGSYAFFVKSEGKRHWVVALVLNHSYSFSNEYLQDNSPISEGFSKYFTLGPASDYDETIKLKSGQRICSIQAKDIRTPAHWIGYCFISISLLALLAGYQRKGWYMVLAPFILFFLLANAIAPEALSNHPWLKPTLFAGVLFGSHFAGAITLSLTALFLLNKVRSWLQHPIVSAAALYLTATLSFLFTYEIIQNSLIEINTNDILGINFSSLVSFIVHAVYVWFFYKFIKQASSLTSKVIGLSISLIPLLVLSSIGVLNFLIPISLATIFILDITGFYVKPIRYRYPIILTILFLSVQFVFIEISDENKERDELGLVVNKIADKRDRVAEEFLLNDLRTNLAKDQYIKSFFTNPFFPKLTVEERLDKLYIRGYLRKFDYDILFLPKRLKLGYNPDKDLTSRINDILTYSSEKIDDGIYLALNSDHKSTYLAEQVYTEGQDTLGTLLVLLSEKTFYDQSIYPELLIANEDPFEEFIKAYAVYEQNTLILSKGGINYPLKLIDGSSIEAALTQNENSNVVHKVFEPSEDTAYVISLREKGLLNYLGAYSSYLFIIGAILIAFIIGMAPKRVRSAFLSLAMRIRVVIVASVLFALIILAYSTALYTSNTYEKESVQQILDKLRKAQLYFSELAEGQPGSNIKNNLIRENTLLFSELYETDIDIFDAGGRLAFSSQQVLYKNGILENMIDGMAFYELNVYNRSQYVKHEKVGLLSYLTAFSPILKNKQIVGYIQLPYFTRQEDLRKEQTTFFVALFNIYLILVGLIALVSALLARSLTKPLSFITNQLRKTTLTGSNEKLEWEREDEIGLLVKEYNLMIDKLEASAKQLAESKQTEAWKEMSRQVAHEIKNPLTPMKLNIQQLQRAWKDKGPKLDKQFDKVTSILIQQIDILSRIASEFSSFAKMPEMSFGEFSISKMIQDVADLYNHDEIIVNVDYEGGEIKVNGDRDQLFRAVNNIVKNGIQATRPGEPSQINIKLETSNGKLRVHISDNGAGIPEELRDRIFTPNFSTKSSGMGLGLAIVKQVILQHEGSIHFQSEAGIGTTFLIELPFRR